MFKRICFLILFWVGFSVNANTDMPILYNSDSYPDLVSVDSYGCLEVLVNDKANGFTQAENNCYVQADADWLWLHGDVNDDNHGDIVGLDKDRKKYVVLRNNGNNSGFTPIKGELTTQCPSCNSYLLVDANSDRKIDLVAVFRLDERFLVYPSNGNGTFENAYVALNGDYPLETIKNKNSVSAKWFKVAMKSIVSYLTKNWTMALSLLNDVKFKKNTYIARSYDFRLADLDGNTFFNDIMAVQKTKNGVSFRGYQGKNRNDKGFLSLVIDLTDTSAAKSRPDLQGNYSDSNFFAGHLDNHSRWGVLAFRAKSGKIVTWMSTTSEGNTFDLAKSKATYEDGINYSAFHADLADIDADNFADLVVMDIAKGVIKVFFNKGNDQGFQNPKPVLIH